MIGPPRPGPRSEILNSRTDIVASFHPKGGTSAPYRNSLSRRSAAARSLVSTVSPASATFAALIGCRHAMGLRSCRRRPRLGRCPTGPRSATRPPMVGCAGHPGNLADVFPPYFVLLAPILRSGSQRETRIPSGGEHGKGRIADGYSRHRCSAANRHRASRPAAPRGDRQHARHDDRVVP